MLGSPGNFKITATKVGEINLSWEPPFSLNLTTADPDIAYCVDVYNVTDIDGRFSPLISNCDVNTPISQLIAQTQEACFSSPSLPGVKWREPGMAH